jgi:O-antigen/teichoic acid export membrane protein
MTTGSRALARVLAGQGLNSLANFATLLALGRWGGEAELGLFALGWSCWFLALSLGDTLVATPYTYHRAQPRAAGPDLTMAAAWGTLALAAALALGLTCAWAAGLPGLGALWPALPLAVAAALMREFRRRHLLAVGDAGALLRLDVAGALLQGTGLLLLAAAGPVNASRTLWLLALCATLPLLPLLTQDRLRRLTAAATRSMAELRAFFDYGRWLLLGGLCHVLGVQAYPWLAFATGGTRAAGLLAACTAILNTLSPLLTGLTNHFRPRFMAARVQLPGSAFVGYTLHRLPAFVLPALLLWLLLLLAGPLPLTQLYGPAYAEAAPALQWLAMGAAAVAVAAPLQLALLARGAPLSNLLYHGSALLALSLAVLLTEPASLLALARICAWVNVLGAAVLAVLLLRPEPGAAALGK